MTTTIHLAPSIARRAVLSRRIRLFAAAKDRTSSGLGRRNDEASEHRA